MPGYTEIRKLKIEDWKILIFQFFNFPIFQLSLFLFILFIASCKAPLPVYFDKPTGQLADTFPGSIQGSYYLIDEIINKGRAAFEGEWRVINDKIVKVDTDTIDEILAPPMDTITKNEPAAITQEPKQESEGNYFYKIAALNKLSIEHIDSAADLVDKEKKIVFAFIKIRKDRISLIMKDSTGGDHDLDLIRLGKDVKLSTFDDDHYLNIRTPWGWEYLRIAEWNGGDMLNIAAFYFTDYNNTTGDVKIFVNSTQEIYPSMQPIYNKDRLIIGMKAKSEPKMVRQKFKRSQNSMILMKIGG